MHKINWKEYAQKVGIESADAYKMLFGAHRHPASELGDETAYVPMDVAIDAVKLVETDYKIIFEKWKQQYYILIQEQQKYIQDGEYLSARIALNRATTIKEMLYHLGYEIKD
ncbi:MAG: hypothetical protein ACOCVF_01495 [bacterium]